MTYRPVLGSLTWECSALLRAFLLLFTTCGGVSLLYCFQQ